uniref:Uncharacterized protein n=1 Tax=Rhizophora mucronata TaxID=61149 RepID=A0A2P2PJ08_RHIMU
MEKKKYQKSFTSYQSVESSQVGKISNYQQNFMVVLPRFFKTLTPIPV